MRADRRRANIQLAATLPNFLILKSLKQWDGFHAKLLKKKIEWQDGNVIPSKEPGVGVELDEAVCGAHPFDGRDLHLQMAQNPLFPGLSCVWQPGTDPTIVSSRAP